MRRCEIWWAEMPEPSGRRPVVLLSRDEAYLVRDLVTIAPLTTRIRDIPVEVKLDKKRDGVPKNCVANLDMIMTVRKEWLVERICVLKADKAKEIEEAARFALGIEYVSNK